MTASANGIIQRLNGMSVYAAALIVLVLAFGTIAGAWIFEWAGFLPCDLCLKQRWAYYAGIPLALLAATAGAMRKPRIAVPLLGLIGVIFVASAVFGVYHAGVEWKFWEGPSGCTASGSLNPSSMADFRKQIEAARIIPCGEAAIRILGLSLAGWNAIVSLIIAAAAFKPVLVASASRG